MILYVTWEYPSLLVCFLYDAPSFLRANSRPEMGIIVSCLAGVAGCIGECLMGIIGAIVDCLGCVLSGAPLSFSESLFPDTSDERRAQRSLDFSRELWTAYVIASVAGKLPCMSIRHAMQWCLEVNVFILMHTDCLFRRPEHAVG